MRLERRSNRKEQDQHMIDHKLNEMLQQIEFLKRRIEEENESLHCLYQSRDRMTYRIHTL